MTKIFYGDEEERDFSHPDKYACYLYSNRRVNYENSNYQWTKS